MPHPVSNNPAVNNYTLAESHLATKSAAGRAQAPVTTAEPAESNATQLAEKENTLLFANGLHGQREHHNSYTYNRKIKQYITTIKRFDKDPYNNGIYDRLTVLETGIQALMKNSGRAEASKLLNMLAILEDFTFSVKNILCAVKSATNKSMASKQEFSAATH